VCGAPGDRSNSRSQAELKGLKKGRYVLLPIDEPPELTEECVPSAELGDKRALN
jgi:hypothetical protein